MENVIAVTDGDFDKQTGIVTLTKDIDAFTYYYNTGNEQYDLPVCIHILPTEWEVRTQPTCTKEGEEYTVCICGEEITRSIPKTEHTFGSWIVEKPASSEEDRLEYRICSVCQYKETHIIPADEYRAGDTDSDGVITSDDATYLLYHIFYPSDYPVRQDCDFNKDGSVTSDDATYLLYHVFYPDDYPLVSN